MELTLKRILFTDDGIAGVLIYGNRIVCFTLEEEWKNNAKSISSIPEGSYLCARFIRVNGLVTYQVTNVPGRTYILFHPGTTELNTEGCILTGMEFGEVKAKDDDTNAIELQLAVLRSREAFEKFMAVAAEHESFVLHIKNC